MLPNELIWLFLVVIEDRGTNGLRLVALEASTPSTPFLVAGDFTAVGRIAPSPGVQAIEIVWDDYIAYAVIDESFAAVQEGVPAPTCNLSELHDPAMDRFIASQTIASPDHPVAPFKSWRLLALDRVVLVTSTKAPHVSRIDMQPEWIDQFEPPA